LALLQKSGIKTLKASAVIPIRKKVVETAIFTREIFPVWKAFWSIRDLLGGHCDVNTESCDL
jgi:hypothetical protein